MTNQKHLLKEQKGNLTLLLEEMKEIFQVHVGTPQGIKIDFELCKDAKPKCIQLHSILVALKQVTKNVITMMWDQVILKEVQEDT